MISSIKYFFIKNFFGNILLKLIFFYYNDFGRPWYRHTAYTAFNEAKKLNYNKCFIIEFVLRGGTEIRMLRKICENFSNMFNFDIKIVIFNSLSLRNIINYYTEKVK